MDNSEQLRKSANKAIAQLGIGGVLGKVISLGATLLLTRLLLPADYGTMALAMTFIAFIGYFNEVGVGASIVQKKELIRSEVNGCFLIAIAVSFVLCGLTLLFAPLVALFFDAPKLTNIVRALSVVFILGSLSTVPIAFLRREMRFKVLAILGVAEVLVNSSIAIVLAFLNFGVWSLVFGFIASSLMRVVLSFYFSRWRPVGAYKIKEAMELVAYGLHVTASRVFWYIYISADKIVIGRILGVRLVGVYDMAFSLATLLSGQITTLVTNVASPLFSKLQSDRGELVSSLKRLTRGIVFITYPTLIGMFVCSDEIISILLSATWSEVLVPFNVLCLLGLVKSFDPLLSQILISTGYAKRLSIYTFVCGVVMVASCAIGATKFGLLGVSLVWVTVYPLLTLRLLSEVCAVIEMTKMEFFGNIAPVLISSLVMGLAMKVARMLLLAYTKSPLVLLPVEVVVGFVVYLSYSAVFYRSMLLEIRSVLNDIGVPVRWLRFDIFAKQSGI